MDARVTAFVMVGCVGTDPPSHAPDTVTTVDVACAQPGDNTLRWSCTVTVEPPQPATLVVTSDDGAVAVTLQVPATEGPRDVPVRFLRPLTSYAVTVTAGAVDAATVFATGNVPTGARLTYTVEGTSSVPYLLHTSPCLGADVVVVSDTRGAVVWYESLGLGPGAELRMADLTEDGTVIVVADGASRDKNLVREMDWDGNTLFQVSLEDPYAARFHHDATKHAGLVYTLFHHDVVLSDGLTYKEDGYYVFDASGAQVEEWRLFDHFTPPPSANPGADAPIDYSHTNSIHVSDDLQVLLSLRFLSAVASVQGDPTQEDYGAILWRLGGNRNDAAFGTDFTLSSSVSDAPSFLLQHHVLPDGPDRITMFDNRGFVETQLSRVIGIKLDHTLGVADIDETYTLAQHCNFQGAAFFTAEGNPVATCAKPDLVYEWDAGVPETPRFKMSARCADGPDTYVGRFVPVVD